MGLPGPSEPSQAEPNTRGSSATTAKEPHTILAPAPPPAQEPTVPRQAHRQTTAQVYPCHADAPLLASQPVTEKTPPPNEITEQYPNNTNQDNIPKINFELVCEEDSVNNLPIGPQLSNVAVSVAETISLTSATHGALDDVTQGALAESEPVRGVNTVMAGAQDGEKNMMTEDTTESQNDTNTPQSDSSPVPKPQRTAARTRARPERTEPTVHQHTIYKNQDWRLTVRKPILIIGDSNLARIPVFTDERVQVDSYPGATCSHVTHLLKKLSIQPQVEHVILSVGLNNCLREQTTPTSCKQLQQLVAVTTTAFPMAIIHVPIIHYSNKIPENQQVFISEMNQKIRLKYNFLTRIDRPDFTVNPNDPIHWTKETADKILKHWLSKLNM